MSTSIHPTVYAFPRAQGVSGRDHYSNHSVRARPDTITPTHLNRVFGSVAADILSFTLLVAIAFFSHTVLALFAVAVSSVHQYYSLTRCAAWSIEWC